MSLARNESSSALCSSEPLREFPYDAGRRSPQSEASGTFGRRQERARVLQYPALITSLCPLALRILDAVDEIDNSDDAPDRQVSKTFFEGGRVMYSDNISRASAPAGTPRESTTVPDSVSATSDS